MESETEERLNTMATGKTMKAAMVGIGVGHAGTVGPERPRFIHTFRQMEGVEVVAYCEWFDPTQLDDAKEHHPEANRYDNLDDLIAKEEFDFASVILAPSEMPGALLKLAEAGKPFFADKQFARKSEDLFPVVEAVRRNNVPTIIGYVWRFHPVAQDLRRLVEEGVLGTPLDIESRQFWFQVGGKLGRDTSATEYRADTEGGGVLHYVGCHHLDLMRAIMGSEVKSVMAMMGRPRGYMDEPLEDIAVLALEYENGGYGGLHHGYTKPVGPVPQGYDSAFVFRGTEGWAEWTPVGSGSLQVVSLSEQWRGSPEKVINYEVEARSGFNLFLEDFVDDIRHGRKNDLLTMDDALYVLQSIDAAYESARTGERVEVKYGLDV